MEHSVRAELFVDVSCPWCFGSQGTIVPGWHELDHVRHDLRAALGMGSPAARR